MNLTLLSDIAKTALGLFLIGLVIHTMVVNPWVIGLSIFGVIIAAIVCVTLIAAHSLGETVMTQFGKVAQHLFGSEK